MPIHRLWIIVSFLTCIFLLGISSTKAQNVDTRIADSLYAKGRFSDAALEYERQFFHAEDRTIRTKLRLKRVQCLKQLGRYEESIKDLNELPLSGITDSLQQEIRYEIALNAYLSGDFETTKSQLQQMHFYTGQSLLPDKVMLLEILNNNQRFDYEKARDLALIWISTLDVKSNVKDSLSAEITKLYRHKNQPRITKAKKASFLSTVMPGSGQVYDGFFSEGSLNFLLSLAVLGTGTYAFIEGYYFTGYLFGAGLLQKLYFGGIRRASILSARGNYMRTKDYNDNLRKSLIRIYDLKNHH